MITALGLMSGTSMDAIDVAWLRTDGDARFEFGPRFSLPIPPHTREAIKEAMEDARKVKKRETRTHLMAEAEDMVDALHIHAVEAFAWRYPKEFQQVELIGYHGQTVFHAPEKHLTIQLGRGQVLADKFKLPVIYDFRAADVAAGGQGAPLVPIFHKALVGHFKLPLPCAFVNIGGVANVTWIGQKDKLLAFDCGPGNALIDDAMLRLFDRHFDEKGRTASLGTVNQKVLNKWLSHKYFSELPPKSLDRNAFPMAAAEALSPQDAIATITEFTVQGIAKSAEHFPEKPWIWFVAGGGSKNDYIMRRLKEIWPTKVQTASDYEMSEDFLEAQAFAYLAVRSQKKLPLSFPTTTRVPKPTKGGVRVG